MNVKHSYTESTPELTSEERYKKYMLLRKNAVVNEESPIIGDYNISTGYLRDIVVESLTDMEIPISKYHFGYDRLGGARFSTEQRSEQPIIVRPDLWYPWEIDVICLETYNYAHVIKTVNIEDLDFSKIALTVKQAIDESAQLKKY